MRFRGFAPQRRALARAAATCAFACALWAAAPAAASNPNALWLIVHGACVADEQTFKAPAPCTQVDLPDGYAVLKDLVGATQYLVIPTNRVTGIESPDLLAPSAPNYWRDAWRARRFVESSLGRAAPRDDIGLAINSADGRSQNQLHIHVDCVRADVRDALESRQKSIGARWSTLNVAFSGHRYRVRRVDDADFSMVNPFKLLAQTDPHAKADMGLETLVAIGATFPGGQRGFYLLSDRADLPFDHGSGEDLLDHQCRILR